MDSTKTSDRALEILLQRLEDSKARNSSFSLRAFAQRLDLSSGALSEVLNGKRPLSIAIKKRIAPKLLLSPQEELEFFQCEIRTKAPDQIGSIPPGHFGSMAPG